MSKKVVTKVAGDITNQTELLGSAAYYLTSINFLRQSAASIKIFSRVVTALDFKKTNKRKHLSYAKRDYKVS